VGLVAAPSIVDVQMNKRRAEETEVRAVPASPAAGQMSNIARFGLMAVVRSRA
jgi:hypothetical protein